ncbi:MAG TPA: PEP-CTERM sorting domain-containing protein [Bryobacteraceae bacterium]|nr:PEP-CTERM sorting domain-containing protein [Bryobacteraceae bacterium]
MRSVFFVILFVCFVFRLNAAVIGGVDFPQGAISFADEVVSYSPGFVGSNPTTPYRGSFNAIGLPDFAGASSCPTQSDCQYVTLGDGGSIILRFVDNQLTGSGDNGLDLWVFEIGGDVEDTFVEISTDGLIWNPVGKVFGSTAGVDIDAFGFGLGSMFSYVRLIDDTNEGDQNGVTVGADIDAVGAISTVASNPVPEPASFALFVTGLLAVILPRRKRSGR